jgi:hypothetical protein
LSARDIRGKKCGRRDESESETANPCDKHATSLSYRWGNC